MRAQRGARPPSMREIHFFWSSALPAPSTTGAQWFILLIGARRSAASVNTTESRQQNRRRIAIIAELRYHRRWEVASLQRGDFPATAIQEKCQPQIANYVLFWWSSHQAQQVLHNFAAKLRVPKGAFRWGIWFNPFSAGTVFRRQNLTSVDVRFWRLKTIHALKELK